VQGGVFLIRSVESVLLLWDRVILSDAIIIPQPYRPPFSLPRVHCDLPRSA
jgi:hypothetical protein